MRALQNLLVFALFIMALVGVLMILAFAPVETSFLPVWLNTTLELFPSPGSPSGALSALGLILLILVSAGGVWATSRSAGPASTD